MNLKQIITILAILALCIGGVLMVNSSRSSAVKAPPAVLGEQPFEELPVNDVAGFSIKGSEEEVSLEKSDGKWRVANRGGYPADFSKVSKLIRGLVEIKVAEAVPAGASALERLELLPPGEGEATKGVGVSVRLEGEGGSELTSFILGKEYEGGMTSGPFGSFANSTGRFMKKGDAVVIVSGTLPEANASAASWLNKDFFQVQKIRKIEFKAESESDSWTLSRSEELGEYILLNPKDDEVLDQAKSGPLKNAFSSPSFKDVVADASDESTGLADGKGFKIETFDGFSYDIKIGNATDDGDYYLTVDVDAEFPTEYVAEEVPAADDTADGGGDAEAAAKQKEEEFNKEVERKREKLEKEKALSGIVFVANKWSVESLMKKRADLLTEAEEAEVAGEGEVPLIPAPAPGGASASRESAGSERPRITAVTPPIEVPLPGKKEEAPDEAGEGSEEPADAGEGAEKAQEE